MNELITENKLIVSGLLIVVALVVRWFLILNFSKLPRDEQDLPKRWSNTTKNIINLLIGIGLIIIWLSELRFVALSIATFVVALVIATRELIQCFIGSLYQISTRTFSIGDWVKIGNHYGEVVSSDWLNTRILEIDMENASYDYTGKTLVFPNNQFITAPIQNLNFMRRYIAHTIVIVRDSEQIDLFAFKPIMLKKAQEYCESFSEVAQRYSGLIEKRLGISLIGPGASVRVTTTNIGKNQMSITVFCPTQEAVNIEQKLMADFMVYWYKEIERVKLEKEERKKNNSIISTDDLNG